jgi:hypothetical protein
MSESKKGNPVQYRFHIFVGPCLVKQVAKRLQDGSIIAHDGTQNVYGQITADDRFQGMDRINKAAGFRLVSYPSELRLPD